MPWQDIVITIANILFSISLIPQVFYGFKEKSGPIKFQTSVPTFVGLYVISIAFWSMALYFSGIISVLTATLWLLLFIQRIIYHKK